MMQEGLKHFSEMPLMVFGMLLFLTIYVGAIIWTLFTKSSRQNLDKLAALPLTEDEVLP